VVGGPALTVRGLCAGRLAGVDLTVHSGEIVGLAGLAGSGLSTALRAIFGAEAVTGGTVVHGGRECRRRSSHALVREGVALVPQDRLGEAAFADLTVRENADAATPGRHWRPWGFRLRADRRETTRLLEGYGISAPGTEAAFLALSGGNQQKVVLARWLRRHPRLLLLDEPTQGVDVLARAEVHRLVRAAAETGCAVLVASSDHEELATLCHRVLVLADGRVVAELPCWSAGPDRITRLTQYAYHPSEG
jgi:ribose transport system ATP-binding protein